MMCHDSLALSPQNWSVSDEPDLSLKRELICDKVFGRQHGSSINNASISSVSWKNDARACIVYEQVASLRLSQLADSEEGCWRPVSTPGVALS
jgi:hypothetical protein